MTTRRYLMDEHEAKDPMADARAENARQLEAAPIAGYRAFYQGARYTDNPHNSYLDPKLADAWSKGWLAADDDLSRDSMRYEQGDA